MDLRIQCLEKKNKPIRLTGEQPNAMKVGEDEPRLHREIEALIPRLTRYARSLTHDLVEADDLVQESLSRALAKIHLWRPGTDLRAWLFTIMHHQHVNELRRAAREKNVPLGDRDQAFEPRQAKHLELRDLARRGRNAIRGSGVAAEPAARNRPLACFTRSRDPAPADGPSCGVTITSVARNPRNIEEPHSLSSRSLGAY
jgi:RNA polymerase sigma factor (sigma-70 family)